MTYDLNFYNFLDKRGYHQLYQKSIENLISINSLAQKDTIYRLLIRAPLMNLNLSINC
jgi:hypothetical protein